MLIRWWLAILAVVVDKRRAESDIALTRSSGLTIIVKIALIVNILIVIDLFNKLQLYAIAVLRAF